MPPKNPENFNDEATFELNTTEEALGRSTPSNAAEFAEKTGTFSFTFELPDGRLFIKSFASREKFPQLPPTTKIILGVGQRGVPTTHPENAAVSNVPMYDFLFGLVNRGVKKKDKISQEEFDAELGKCKEEDYIRDVFAKRPDGSRVASFSLMEKSIEVLDKLRPKSMQWKPRKE